MQLKTIRILSAEGAAETANASGVKIMRCSPHAAANLLQFAFMSESHAQDGGRAQDLLGCGGSVKGPLRRCTCASSRRKGSDVTSRAQSTYGLQESLTAQSTASFCEEVWRRSTWTLTIGT